MYGMMLAAMLTTGTMDAPAWWHCHGCYGGWGHGCHGWWGGHGCHSCYATAGCYCYGGCMAGYGTGCWGWYGYACSGCGYCSGYWDCFGCYGSYGGYGAPVMVAPPAMPGATMPSSQEKIGAPTKEPPKNGKDSTALPERARILVRLPADAKFFVDDRPVMLPAGRQTVVTPALEPGRDYYYVFRAEAVRDGKPVSDTKRVVIRAGSQAVVDFTELATTKADESAGEPSRIIVRLPANARLFIDDVAVPLASVSRTFVTPKLQPGKSYYYVLKAEVERDGKPHAETRRVVVQAGKDVRVDFGDLSAVVTAQR